MKKIILVFGLLICFSLAVLAQETPIKLVKKARILVKDSADLVENRKELIQETKALIKEVQNLGKKTKFKKNANYQIGLTFQPFNFRNYQSQEGAAGTLLIKPKIFNGFAFGLTFRKKLNKHFSLRTEITYATQSEKFSSSRYSTNDPNGENKIYVYNSEDKLKYNVTRLPLLIDYNLKLGSNGWAIHGYTGLQLAYLNNYVRLYRSYEVIKGDNDVFIVNRDILFSELFDKNGKGYGKYLAPNDADADADGYVQYTELDVEKDAIFRIWSLAVVSGLEIEKKINSKYAIGFGLRYEYNLSKTESSKYEEGKPVIYNTFEIDNGGTSNQRRIGMTFSILKTIY